MSPFAFFILNEAGGGGNGAVPTSLSDISGNTEQVVLIVLGLLATCIAILGYVIRGNKDSEVAAKQATEANNAVNNVGPGEHRLYDKITAIAEDVHENKEYIRKIQNQQEDFLSHGWGNLPPDLANGVALTVTIRELQRQSQDHMVILERIENALLEHVQWEMDEKYGRHGGPLTSQMPGPEQ